MKINTEITTKEQAETLIEKLKNFNEPLQFGRWIKDDEHPKWLGFYDKENNIHYGITGSGNWIKQECVDNPNNYSRNRYATDQEILDGLSKMALKMGFKKGCSFELDDFLWGRSYGGKRGTNHLDSEPIFKYEDNTLYIIKGYNCLVIMKGGKWAKIIKQEPTTIESLEKRIAALESKLK